MKKRILMLLLILVFMTGCANENAKAPQEQSTIEGSIVKEDTESVAHAKDDKGIDSVDAYITSVKKKSDAIKASLEKDDLTQTEMNIKAQELYELWDEALNFLWDELKSGLSEEDFSKLLTEQLTWIAEKEKAVEAAGKEFEGGSVHALIVSGEAAKITEERVYELYDILNR